MVLVNTVKSIITLGYILDPNIFFQNITTMLNIIHLPLLNIIGGLAYF